MSKCFINTKVCLVQAKSHTIESQLAQTTAELASLRASQLQLEHGQRQLRQRNALLEQMAKLNSHTSTQLSLPAQHVNAKLHTALQVRNAMFAGCVMQCVVHLSHVDGLAKKVMSECNGCCTG